MLRGFKKFILKLLVKPLVVNEKPYKKNSHTAPEFIIADERDFEKEKSQEPLKTDMKNLKNDEQKMLDNHFSFFSVDKNISGLMTPEEKNAFLKQLRIKNEPVIVVGSTHDPEERIFLEAFRNIKNKIPSAKLILVPRHPERFDSVAKLITDKGFDLKRFSQNDDKEASVILVDTMGQLKKCYQIATIAAVAGSWTAKVNGHNILEPSFYGKAEVYGPYMSSQPDFLRLMKDYNGGVQVLERDIEKTLLQLLENQKERDKMGERGKQLVSESKGALKRTLEALSLF